MSEIGDGSGSSYPASLDTDNSQESTATVARSNVPNDLAASIIAVQTELGTDPAGSVTDVKTFLQAEHETDGTHNSITPTSIQMPAGSTNITQWPSFDVYLGTNQSGTGGGTFDKIEFDTEVFDTNNDFDSTTNFRFTPTIAGKYLLTSTIQIINTADNESFTMGIYKNGSLFKANFTNMAGTSAQYSHSITAIVDANGSGDYYEIFIGTGSGAFTIDASASSDSYFGGSRIA